ncbi:MAG: protein translocase subunit SecF [Desulfatiglans sp.]|jgi:preprotein translocase subunit SecF|nr:protein translocase subunit SecF [Thermodesulfobacteriota bacterium]MEE4353485.1 protein translocase subunit SecF [Desulfatiglans sp.]
MEFIKPGINIDFVGKRKAAFVISALLIVITCLLLIWREGPNYGVDFTGGVLIQVKLDQARTPAEIRAALESVQLQDSIIQEFGEQGKFEYLIRVRKTEIELSGLSNRVKQALILDLGQGVEIRRVEMVGPKVGEDLRQKALFAIFYAILFIAVYISGRFELKWLMSMIMGLSLAFVVYISSSFNMSVTWLIVVAMIVTIGLCWVLNLKYALGAIIALIHDVTITVGAFALTDREISLSIIAAFLTIVGYSLNDTIIVFDRIRENLGRFRKKPFAEVLNRSINETLSRTVLTSTTTLVVILALFFLGGGVIHDFAFAILIGILVGTYSSVFVASPILMIWEGDFAGKTRLVKK